MCRSSEDGGRRCPCGGRRTGAALEKHNERRRQQRAARRDLADQARQVESLGEVEAAKIMSLPPAQAIEYAAALGLRPASSEPSVPEAAPRTVAERASLFPADAAVRRSWERIDDDVRDGETKRLLKQSSSWVKGLSADETHAILTYSGADYSKVNEAFFRYDGIPHLDRTDARLRDVAQSLDSAFAQTAPLNADELVYRGVRLDNVTPSGVHEWAVEKFPVGGIVHFPAYTSTSHDPSVASGMIPSGLSKRLKSDPATTARPSDSKARRGMVFEMVTNRGGYVGQISDFGTAEQERILGRGADFEVVAVKRARFERPYQVPGTPPHEQPVDEVTIVQLVDVTGEN